MKSISFCIWCCCLLALINGQLKPIVKSDNVYRNAVEIISMYNNVFQYNTFILYGNFRTKGAQAVGSSFAYRIMKEFEKPVINAGPQTDSLHNLISTRNFAVAFFSGNYDPMLDIVQNTMSRLAYLPILFVYKSKNNVPMNIAATEAFFTWCWKSHLYYVTLIKSDSENDIWAYDFKSNLTIHQITEQRIRDFHPTMLGLMRGHQSTVSVYKSVPDVFVYESSDQRDLTGVNKSLGGGIGIMILEFMRYVNGTLRILEIPTNNLGITKSQFGISNITIDISANMEWKSNVNRFSPSIMPTKYCMVVPHERHISFRKYLFKIYGNWTLILFLVFYFTANALIKKLNHRRMSLDEIFFRSLEITLNQPICNQIIRCMRIAEKIMMICSMTYNFLILALFAGALTTHITTGFHMPEIVDVDSFLVNDLRIMVPISEEKAILKLETVPKEIANKMIFVDEKIYHQHLNSLNDNFVYIIAAHKWVQYEFIQKRLRQPKLKMASDPLCGVVRFLKLPVRPELPLTFKLNNFIDYTWESGLNKKWMRMGLEQMKKAKLIHQHPYDPPMFVPLNLEFFMSVFIFLLSSLSVSLVVFLFECILMQWRQHRNAYNNVIIV